MTATVVVPVLIGGTDRAGNPMHNRIRCDACRRMVPMYVDRGDGEPLRLTAWSKGSPSVPDPTLDVGFCVMAYDVLPACPFCGYTAVPAWGRNASISGTFGDGPCGADCHEATGDKCRCSCGGANHGIL
jgi:hypothetical protein